MLYEEDLAKASMKILRGTIEHMFSVGPHPEIAADMFIAKLPVVLTPEEKEAVRKFITGNLWPWTSGL